MGFPLRGSHVLNNKLLTLNIYYHELFTSSTLNTQHNFAINTGHRSQFLIAVWTSDELANRFCDDVPFDVHSAQKYIFLNN